MGVWVPYLSEIVIDELVTEWLSVSANYDLF